MSTLEDIGMDPLLPCEEPGPCDDCGREQSECVCDVYDTLHKASETFWSEFSALVNKTLKKVPEDFREVLETRLQEKANVYSRDEDIL